MTTPNRSPSLRPAPAREFAIRVGAIEELFAPLDARPISERALTAEVRLHLLDQWDLAREARPSALTVYVTGGEPSRPHEEAASAAIHRDLRTQTRPYWRASPLARREKIAAWIGIVIFVISIAISTSIDRVSTAVLVAGISQGIVVVGWVALWDPVQRVAGDVIPHQFDRKRYAEFAEIDLRFVWQDTAVSALPEHDPSATPSTSSPR